MTAAELQRRQEELERKAAELAAREEALRNGTFNPREPNWPPIPSVCPFGPFIYQDINVEIPVEFQKVVRLAYYLWMCKCRELFVRDDCIAMTGCFSFDLRRRLRRRVDCKFHRRHRHVELARRSRQF